MRHIIPIGRPRWVYKSDVKCSFLESWFLESDLKWPNDLEGQDQWPLYSKPVWRISRRIFGTNLMILVQIHYKVLHGQAKFPRILSQNGQNYLECQGQWPLILNNSWEYPMMHTWHKFGDSSPNGQNYLEGRDEWLIFSIPTESVSGCMFIAKLVIIAQIGGQLSHVEKVKFMDWQTDWQTDGPRQRQYPFGLKGQRAIKMKYVYRIFVLINYLWNPDILTRIPHLCILSMHFLSFYAQQCSLQCNHNAVFFS